MNDYLTKDLFVCCLTALQHNEAISAMNTINIINSWLIYYDSITKKGECKYDKKATVYDINQSL